MQYFSIDYLIVYAFLAITMVIGFKAGKGIKDVKEYALGDKIYGTLTLLLTYLATNIGSGSVIHGVSDAYSEGIIACIVSLGIPISLIIRGVFIAPKMPYFDGCLTIGDVINTSYGKLSQVIAGFLGVLYSIAMLSAQLLGIGLITSNLLGMDGTVGIIIGGSILTLYSAHGGIKSVTVTDVFQFIILIVVFPLLANAMLEKAGGLQAICMNVPVSKFEVLSHRNFSYYLTLFIVWSIFPVGITSPPIFQRMLMAQKAIQLRQQCLMAAIFDPIFRILLLLIGLAGIVCYSDVAAKNILMHIINDLLPVGAKGLAIAGLLAVVMSTADSYLLSAGLALAHDIIKPICDKRKIVINELRWAQYSTLIIGVIIITVALQANDMLGLSFLAVKFTGPLLMFPLIAVLLGLKSDKDTFYISSLITLLIFIGTSWYLPKNYDHLAVPISIASNIIIFLAIHLIKNGRFVMVVHKNELPVLQATAIKKSFNVLALLISLPQRLIQYSQGRVEKYGASYMLFGGFFLTNYLLPYFLWSHTAYYNFIFILRLIGGIYCTLLILQDKWPQGLRRYLPIFWHFTILYCLPFMSTMMFLLAQGSTEWLINIAITIILLFILVDWLTGLLLSMVGLVLAVSSYWLLIGPMHLSLDFSSQYLLLYQIVFGLLIGLIFARRREQGFKALFLQNQQLTENQQAVRKELASTLSYREQLLHELNPDEAALFDDMTTAYIQQVIYRITDYLRLDVTFISLDTLQRNLSDFYRHAQSSRVTIAFKNYTQQAILQGDFGKIKQLFINAIQYISQRSAPGYSIMFAIEDAKLGHLVAHMPHYIRQLEALKITITDQSNLPPTEPVYRIEPARSSTWIPKEEDELLLVENARIIDAHYGYMDVTNPHTHVYVFPLRLREVRGKVMELIKEPAAADAEELNHPVALELERQLMARIAPTDIDKKIVQQALEIIKRYHGGVKRKSGEPFFTHPIAVALIVLDYSQDQEAVLGALLHDTVEDTSFSLVDIKRYFGKVVTFLVAKATNLEDHERRISLPDKENLVRILNYQDPRAALIKLADRLHNMRTIAHHASFSKKQYIAQETLNEFVPLATKLGLMGLKKELEERSRAVLGL